MSDWPQLERRLVESAQRRRRTRIWRPLLLAPAVAAAVAVVVLVSQPGPSDERAVPTVAPAKQYDSPLERDYGVFRTPRGADDELPISQERRDRLSSHCGAAGARDCWRIDTARLVHHDGDWRFYLLQGERQNDLCLISFIGDKGGGGSCTVAEPERAARPMGSYGPPRGTAPATGYTVFPDGVERVGYTFADGTRAVHQVERNFAYVTSDAMITSLSWTVDGTRHVQPIANPEPSDQRLFPQGCPRLDPLPPDAAAGTAEVVGTAARELYGTEPEAARPRPATTADVDGLQRRICGDSLVDRSLVVEFDLKGQAPGALLIGFHDGRAITWSQLR